MSRVESIPGRGKSAYELIDSLGHDVHGLLVVGSNIVVSAPDAVRVEKRLSALDTLVVADFFLSETAQLADVVLPSTQWAEEDGTMTNLEGRVIRRRRAVAPPAGVRSDIEILCGLAAALGKRHAFGFASAADVFAELRKATRGGPADYFGITYERLDDSDGVFWPCPAADHPGTPRLFADAFATASGRARFHSTPHGNIADARSDEFPLLLTTGRVAGSLPVGESDAAHRCSPGCVARSRSSRCTRSSLDARASAPAIRSPSPRHADRRRSARRSRRDIREDAIFVPFHWGGMQSVNRLTNPALDPISRMPEFKVCAADCRRDDE